MNETRPTAMRDILIDDSTETIRSADRPTGRPATESDLVVDPRNDLSSQRFSQDTMADGSGVHGIDEHFLGPMLAEVASCSAVGTADTVRRDLEAFVARTDADEVMVVSHIYEHAARLRSFEITAEVGLSQ